MYKLSNVLSTELVCTLLQVANNEEKHVLRRSVDPNTPTTQC